METENKVLCHVLGQKEQRAEEPRGKACAWEGQGLLGMGTVRPNLEEAGGSEQRRGGALTRAGVCR